MSSDYIRPIYEDRSGVLWIGTSFGGLNKYARSTQKFALYNNHVSPYYNLSDNNIWSIYQDKNRKIFGSVPFFSGLNKLDLNSGGLTIYQHDPLNPMSLSDNDIAPFYR